MALDVRTEFYPIKQNEDGKKKQINKKKNTKKEKDFLLLRSNLLVEVLYLETK